MAENTELLHNRILNENLANNSKRIVQTRQVIEQYEKQIELFNELPNTLKKSVLIPVGGGKGFLRGHIVHTNELYHNVGCGYVIKRTAKQATAFCDRMLAETNQFLNQLLDEERWINDQLKLTHSECVFNTEPFEIIEHYDESIECEWRMKHKDSVKRMKQDEAKNRNNLFMSIDDKALFSRLDELELLEEAAELESKNIDLINNETTDIDVEYEQFLNLDNLKNELNTETDTSELVINQCVNEIPESTINKDESSKLNNNNNNNNKEETQIMSNLEMLRQQLELTRKHRTTIKTENDLIKRLDELEQEENLLEEMELLDETENSTKKNTIRFNEKVRTNFYDSSEAVTEENVDETIITDNTVQTDTDEPVTLEIRFSHTPIQLCECLLNSTDQYENISELIKPSDLYDMPYRPKSILKNKNRIFDEPQHTGDDMTTVCISRKKERSNKDRNWVCFDTFTKNGNDSDQENANIVQVPPPTLSDVKEKPLDTISDSKIIAATSTVVVPPKKRQSRFLVSRALITKK